MKIMNYISFLKNKSSKVKLSFFAIIFLTVLIILADAFPIILLPLVSLKLNYLPTFLIDCLSKIDICTIFIILLLILSSRNLIYFLKNYNNIYEITNQNLVKINLN